MEFERLIKERQSCRSYLPKPVEKEKLEAILSAGRLAPSARNTQPWKLYVATGNRAKAVAECTQDLGFNQFASDAPAFIIVTETGSAIKSGGHGRFAPNRFVEYDIGEMVAYLTLAARDQGLGTCIIGWLNAEKLQAVVGYSSEETCSLVIAVGYSDAPLREKVRKPLEEIVTFIE